MDRRTLLKLAAALSLYGLPFPTMADTQSPQSTDDSASNDFSYAWLKGHARHLASQPHEPREKVASKALQNISWDDYQALQFRPEKGLWRNDESLFQVGFFHLGLFFQRPVRFYEVVDGKARPIKYDRDNFSYDGEQPLGDLPDDLGYAGFRVRFHSDFEADLAAFLGASYFRAVGEDLQYGLSARGLAINTGLNQEEEFPAFTTYWLEKPRPGIAKMTVYALLESPSITGAYAFDLYPGQDMVMDISAALYPRKPIERLGIAPLTSMYQMGENDRRMANDWRPEIHDSDGLSLWTGAGEWIWRPLANPEHLRTNTFIDNNPRGFGLLQRDRNFENYQDDGVFYNKRPSLWVEPGENWGEGSVTLVEIPTRDETFDNIVAFWQPKQPLKPDTEHLVSYRLTWGENPPDQPDNLATVKATRTGIGGVVGQERDYFSRRFAIDFSGGMLGMLPDDAEVEAVITASSGEVEITSARPLHSIDGYRAMFDLVPDDTGKAVDLRVYLKLGDQPLTETWIYQYQPPPEEERSF